MTGVRKLIWAFVAAGAVAAGCVYYFFDPAEARWMPRCLWKTLTGTDCPGCGSQRMLHALTHGDIQAAFHANAFAVCMIPVVIFFIWLELTSERHPSLYARIHRPCLIWLFAAIVLAWWILRNLLPLG